MKGVLVMFLNIDFLKRICLRGEIKEGDLIMDTETELQEEDVLKYQG